MTEDRTFTQTYLSTATATATKTEHDTVSKTETETATATVTDTSLYSCLAGVSPFGCGYPPTMLIAMAFFYSARRATT